MHATLRYFVQIMLDTTLVVFLNFVVLRHVEHVILSRYGVDVSSGKLHIQLQGVSGECVTPYPVLAGGKKHRAAKDWPLQRYSHPRSIPDLGLCVAGLRTGWVIILRCGQKNPHLL